MSLQNLAKDVLDRLALKQLTLGIAESVTGGLASHLLTNVDGSSKVFIGAVISYTAQTKNMLLDVDWDVINDNGTISPEVTEALLDGLRKTGADIRIAMTGIAGSPMEGKPTGKVYIGVATSHNHHVTEYQFSGSRLQIKEQTAQKSFELILEEVEKME